MSSVTSMPSISFSADLENISINIHPVTFNFRPSLTQNFINDLIHFTCRTKWSMGLNHECDDTFDVDLAHCKENPDMVQVQFMSGNVLVPFADLEPLLDQVIDKIRVEMKKQEQHYIDMEKAKLARIADEVEKAKSDKGIYGICVPIQTHNGPSYKIEYRDKNGNPIDIPVFQNTDMEKIAAV